MYIKQLGLQSLLKLTKIKIDLLLIKKYDFIICLNYHLLLLLFDDINFLVTFLSYFIYLFFFNFTI